MYVRESSSKNRRFQLWLDFTLLTAEAGLCPEAKILGQTRPHKLGGQEPQRSMHSGCERPCRARNSWWRREEGTRGHWDPEDTSKRTRFSLPKFSWLWVIWESNGWMEWSYSWSFAAYANLNINFEYTMLSKRFLVSLQFDNYRSNVPKKIDILCRFI